MKILVDSCIWSYALRHRVKDTPSQVHHAAELIELIQEARVCLIGPVRQEILSGIKKVDQFRLLREKLKEFPDTAILTEDYEAAADFFNQARAKGIQGSNIDFLICAVSSRLKYPIYTTDDDFRILSPILPISLYSPRLLK